MTATRPTETREIERRQRALGQTANASTEATLYTCPKGRLAEGRVFWCERAGGTPTIRIRVADAADNDKQFLVYGHALAANEFDKTELFWLSPDDRVDVYSSDANVSFTFNGYTIPKDT